MVLGKMCRKMIMGVDNPGILALVTKSNSLMLNTSPRIIRAKRAHTVRATARMTLAVPGPTTLR